HYLPLHDALPISPEMDAYRRDLFWAQEYARRNREVMMALACRTLTEQVPGTDFVQWISCHHNYVAEETYEGVDVLVTRKGAIRAGKGDLGIIPGSMAAGVYIVRGLGNPASYNSAAHGAGRRMSRSKARKTFFDGTCSPRPVVWKAVRTSGSW